LGRFSSSSSSGPTTCRSARATSAPSSVRLSATRSAQASCRNWSAQKGMPRPSFLP
jgi:hypothetical protein